MLRDINYFRDQEFECPCCRQRLISQALVSKLDSARAAYGKPIRITSGYRCFLHNLDVGGIATSSHRRGLAVDIEIGSSTERFELIRILIAVGFIRIGIGEGFIHVDIDPHKTQNVMWTY